MTSGASAAVNTMTLESCAGGTFVPDCTGTLIGDPVNTLFLPPVFFAAGRTHLDATAISSGVFSVTGHVGNVDISPPVPEPGSFLLLGTGLALVLVSARRR